MLLLTGVFSATNKFQCLGYDYEVYPSVLPDLIDQASRAKSGHLTDRRVSQL